MSQGLIAVGTGIASFTGSIALSYALKKLSAGIVITSLAIGLLSLQAKKMCQEDPSQSLTKRDYILLGGQVLLEPPLEESL